jgi:hypothetical protein
MAERQKPRFSKERWGFLFLYSEGAKAMQKKIKSIETVSSGMTKRFSILFLAALLFCGLAGMARAALVDRGGGLIYDNVLNITWLQDANLAATEKFWVTSISAEGYMPLVRANIWIAAMNTANYLGYHDWRLPDAHNQDGTGPYDGPNVTGSEMGHMYYNNLKGTAYGQPLNPTFVDDSGKIVSFQNLKIAPYWSGTGADPDETFYTWRFDFTCGVQNVHYNQTDFYVWAVRPGDVAPVPLPSAIWLFGSGLAGIMGYIKLKGNRRA